MLIKNITAFKTLLSRLHIVVAAIAQFDAGAVAADAVLRQLVGDALAVHQNCSFSAIADGIAPHQIAI